MAEILGISPVTLRSWDSRYGLGPSVREPGRQRRYSDSDVERLQRVRRLAAEGMRIREAAQWVLSGEADRIAEQTGTAAELRRILADAAEKLRTVAMADVLDECFTSLGPAATWQEVLIPLLRELGRRWVRAGHCIDVEWGLTTAIVAAVDRYTGPAQRDVPGDRPIVLICCPEERHSLPMRLLHAVLLQRRLPVVFLGETVPPEVAIGGAVKLRARLAVLWSIAGRTAEPGLVKLFLDRDVPVCLAGPGWDPVSASGTPRTNDLAGAASLIVELASSTR